METDVVSEPVVTENYENDVVVDENDSSVANTNDIAVIPMPMETPSKIPRRQKIPSNAFETPNIKTSDRRLCDLYMSVKKPVEEIQTPAKRISKKELDDFIRRTEEQEELRKKKHDELIHQEEVRNLQIMGAAKKLRKSEIESVSKRLSMTPARQSQCAKRSSLPPETPAPNTHVFDRLYLLSTCRKRMDEEDAESAPAPVCPMSVISNKSSILANKHSIQRIAEEFGDIQFCSHEQMLSFLRNLHILDETSPENEVALCEKQISKCLSSNDTYSACQLKEALIDCFTSRSTSKFSRLVSSKMALARANERAVVKTEETEEDAESFKCAAKMQKETLERLLATRPQLEDETEEEKPQIKSILSDASKSILAKSERTKSISQMSLEERNKLLLQKRDEIVDKLKQTIEKEELSEYKQPTNLGFLPDFYDKLPEEKKRRTKKDDDSKIEENSFKPKINSYEEFQKKKTRFELAQKPTGWEETVERLRLARIERNRIQESLDIRNSLPIKKRVSFAAMKKKKEPKVETNKLATETATLNEAGEIDSILGI